MWPSSKSLTTMLLIRSLMSATGKLRSIRASPVTVPYGSFTDVIETLEWTPLEPGARERKFYARGVGLVLELGKKKERVELVSATLP